MMIMRAGHKVGRSFVPLTPCPAYLVSNLKEGPHVTGECAEVTDRIGPTLPRLPAIVTVDYSRAIKRFWDSDGGNKKERPMRDAL